MSITDELREWAGDNTLRDTVLTTYPPQHAVHGVLETLLRIADRIDVEHEAMLADVRKTVYQGLIELPKDADGEAWHIGDRTESGQTIEAMGLNKHGWHFVGTVNEIDPAIHHHYHAPTVEDVLREFALKAAGRECMTMRNDLVDEYAAKLRLAEGEDA